MPATGDSVSTPELLALPSRLSISAALGGSDLLPRLLPKLARSYALDVLKEAGEAAFRKLAAPHPEATPAAGAVVVRTALDRVGRLAARRTKAVGEVEDLRLREDDFVGSVLIVAGSLAHLSLWAADYR